MKLFIGNKIKPLHVSGKCYAFVMQVQSSGKGCQKFLELIVQTLRLKKLSVSKDFYIVHDKITIIKQINFSAIWWIL